MTTYVVPCGVSLVESLHFRKDKGPLNCKPSSLAEGAAKLGNAVLGLADAERPGMVGGKRRRVCQ